jgi:hypothetical protein
MEYRIFAMEVRTTCDAFKPEGEPELARILRSMADRIEFGLGAEKMTINDINGNSVGTASLKAEG